MDIMRNCYGVSSIFSKGVNRVIAPCKDCDKRYAGCHAQCEEYQRYNNYRAIMRAVRFKRLQAVMDFQGVKEQTFRQQRKRKKREMTR